MAVTDHYLKKNKDGKLVMVSRLIAFRHIKGSHSGKNLAKHFFDILKSFGLLKWVGKFLFSSVVATQLFHLCY